MKEYFYKKEYKYMYLSTISYSFANTLVGTFGTVMLYKNGIPIWLYTINIWFKIRINRIYYTTICNPYLQN